MMLNNMGDKLLRDGSDKARLQANMISMSIGFALLFAGIACLVAKAMLENDTDPEKFFLLPISAVLTFCGVIVFFITGIRNTFFLFKSQKKDIHYKYLSVSFGCTAVTLSYIALVMFLIEANSEQGTMPISLLCVVAALCLGFAAIILNIKYKKICKSNRLSC